MGVFKGGAFKTPLRPFHPRPDSRARSPACLPVGAASSVEGGDLPRRKATQRLAGVAPNAPAKVIVLSGSTGTTRARCARGGKGMMARRRSIKTQGPRSGLAGGQERRRERKVFLPLYDCRESLAYFTPSRKLLSLRCSRSLIIDFHVHHAATKDDEEPREREGERAKKRERHLTRGMFLHTGCIDGRA